MALPRYELYIRSLTLGQLLIDVFRRLAVCIIGVYSMFLVNLRPQFAQLCLMTR